MSIQIKEFDYRNATNDAYEAFNKCRNLIRAEQLPDDPPIPLKETIQGYQNFPDYVGMSYWVASEEPSEDILAYGMLQWTMEDNLHMANFMICVLPEFRRRGIGRDFLSRIVEVAMREKRTLLITNTMDRIPAGEAFLERIGARKGLESHTSQLTIADLDRDLLQHWIERAQERGLGFEIGIWEGEYPEEDVDAIVELFTLFNQQPFGDLELEDFVFTAEQLRQDEQSLFARGYERWTLYVRELETGAFAGYTEVFWNPNRPGIIGQGMTGVFPDYRNKGLGRWLKAEMLQMILERRPQAKWIRTGNADMNAPMLKINNELGFKPYIAECVWQVETDKVADYLGQ
jgi:GNAT superfamily N-acetyltransferase